MDYGQFNSMQDFGYNRFPRPHNVLGSYNAGILYPLGCFDVPMGATVSNDLDIFARSSELGDPSFLDADVSVGHYFVSYEAMDHFFRKRTQQFKGSLQDQPLMQLRIPKGTPYSTLATFLGPRTLGDHLGFGVELPSGDLGNTTSDFTIPLGPFVAYQMIVDRFFRNSRFQNVERTKDALWSMFKDWTTASVDLSNPAISSSEMLMLQYMNYEPDYFTTARAQAGGPEVSIPGFDSLNAVMPYPDDPDANIPVSIDSDSAAFLKELQGATIHNLLDRMLIQKVADMLERGGYSHNDFCRILYHVQANDESAEYPVFLSGSSAPLQVSTVTNQAAIGDTPGQALGAQAGTVSAYLKGDDGFVRRFDRAGLYIPCMWIRPSTYYRSGVSPVWLQKTIGSKLIPQLADMQDAPIYQIEVAAELSQVDLDLGSIQGVFGYKDRYQEYRTTPNRVVGEMRTTRTGWYMPRTSIMDRELSVDFLTQDTLLYTPWVVTDNAVDHFFIRGHHNLKNTVPLPATSRPYVW